MAVGNIAAAFANGVPTLTLPKPAELKQAA
jgi:hypothetical protein